MIAFRCLPRYGQIIEDAAVSQSSLNRLPIARLSTCVRELDLWFGDVVSCYMAHQVVSDDNKNKLNDEYRSRNDKCDAFKEPRVENFRGWSKPDLIVCERKTKFVFF